MLSLPKGYKGKLIAEFEGGKDYTPDCFFKQEGVRTVKSPLGTYIETSGKPLERFGYRFKIENKDKPHILVLAYPDDKRRHMMINDCFSYDLTCGVFTDGEYPISNTVKHIYKVFHTRTTDLTLTVMGWGKNEPAAIMGFAVYELDALPEFDLKKPTGIKTRRYGVQYEDPCGAVSDLGATTLNDWIDKYIEYAKHTGQNVLVQPINWYSGPIFDSETQPGSSWYWNALENHEQYTVTTSTPCDWITPFLEKCEKADIDFIGGMTLLRLGNLIKNMNTDLVSIQTGADTYNNMRCDNKVQTSCNDWTALYNARNIEKMIDIGYEKINTDDFEFVYGEKEDDFGGAPMFNPLHPTVQSALIEYFEEISRRFGTKKAFKGVSLNIWHATLVWFSSLRVGYDDYTVKLFEEETGIKVSTAPDDAKRFSKRYDLLTSQNLELWVKWRCKKIRELILKLRDALRKYDSELTLYICAWNEPVKRTMFGWFNKEHQYPKFISEDEFLRQGGIDISLFENDEGICFSVEQNQHRDRGWTVDGTELPIEQRRFFHDLAYLDKSWINAQAKMKKNAAFVFDSWTEGWGDYFKYPFNEHTPEIDDFIKNMGLENANFFKDTCRLAPDDYWFDSQRQITTCYPTDKNYMEPFAHAVAELDPTYILRGGLYLDRMHTSEIRSYTAAFTALPEVKFDNVGCKNDPITVREKNIDGRHYFYAVNREPFDIKVRIYLKNNALYEEIYNGETLCENKSVVEIVLGAFSMRSFVCDSENVIGWFYPEIPKTEREALTKAYKYQIKVLEWAENEKIDIYGLKETKEELIKAFTNFSPARVRHLIKGYVCLKARTLYENK